MLISLALSRPRHDADRFIHADRALWHFEKKVIEIRWSSQASISSTPIGILYRRVDFLPTILLFLFSFRYTLDRCIYLGLRYLGIIFDRLDLHEVSRREADLYAFEGAVKGRDWLNPR
ncbi:hypothetical protein DJ69_12950 [Halorubrum persicum]|uniref:Uncharacterized protein n=1 Tax=Halorubrum persicum TaxID=1383844 RepID=A0A2G1WGY7_9EURY|nr:hypothetical protein DJ69_12950 [Halorubrum persicum]